MKRTVLTAGLVAAAITLAVLAGCGEKIAVPVAEGVFGIVDYSVAADLVPDYTVRQLKFGPTGLYVLGEDRLVRYNTEFVVQDSVLGITDATSMCADMDELVVFVWEQASQQVLWYDAITLDPLGAATLSGVSAAVDMVTNDAGVGQAPWAATFLYLSDPVQQVVHRYTFDQVNGLISFGILTRADGDGARFVHIPAGLATDSGGKVLVADQDPLRNWVIRFDSTPDTTDVTVNPNDEDPLRGLAFPFLVSECIVLPAGDFVLGYAPECSDTAPWEGRPGSGNGEFDEPFGVAIDGSGRVFVADTGNDRIQIFSGAGEYEFRFGDAGSMPAPRTVGVQDVLVPGEVHYAAYVFVQLGDENRILKYISAVHDRWLNRENPVELP